jgi:cell shape-determining protein MreC
MYYRLEDLNLAPEETVDYLRKSQSDDPLLTVEEVLAKHEKILDEWSIKHLGAKTPENQKFREIVSGETLKYELLVDRLADGSSVFKGDKIVTAESGDVYPAGIMVGTVNEVTVNEKNGEVSATIDLAVDLRVVSKVYVMVSEADKNAKEAENS